MSGAPDQSSLHVEGRDDEYALMHLLIRHGVNYDHEPRPPELPRIRQDQGIEELLKGMETAIRLGTKRTVGFVLDADSPLADRWGAVRSRLRAVGIAAPNAAPVEGFVGKSEEYQARVGAWLMPDNRHDGKLETFLRALIDEDDDLVDLAEASTDKAKQRRAAFPDRDRSKAVLHTWLAWQEEPGRPYGTAIRARYFRDDSPAALAFVSWFKTLYPALFMGSHDCGRPSRAMAALADRDRPPDGRSQGALPRLGGSRRVLVADPSRVDSCALLALTHAASPTTRLASRQTSWNRPTRSIRLKIP